MDIGLGAGAAGDDRRTAVDDRGAAEDFRAIFDAEAARVVRLAALLGAADPEDVAQEAFVRLYAKRERLRAGTPDHVSYLNRIVVNLVRDRHRHATAGARFQLLSRREAETPTESAECIAIRSAEGRRVLDALAGLPPRRREAIVLRFWLDLPYAEIARAMGVSVGSAKSAVSRGVDDLSARLKELS